MKKPSSAVRYIRDQFRDRLHAALKAKFPLLKVETEWNILAMRCITTPIGKEKFTRKEHSFIDGFSAGYASAQLAVEELRNGK